MDDGSYPPTPIMTSSENDWLIASSFFYGVIRLITLFAFLNVLSFIQRKTVKNILRSIRTKYYRFKPGSETEKFETIRENIDDYLKYLESGHTTPFEIIMFGWYTTNVSEENRRRLEPPPENDNEKRPKIISLPVWMEKLIAIYNNVFLFNMAIMIIFFIFGLVWYNIFIYTQSDLNILNSNHQNVVFHSREEMISNLTGVNMSQCDSLFQSNSRYCFLDYDPNCGPRDTLNHVSKDYPPNTLDVIIYTSSQLTQPTITTWDPVDVAAYPVLTTAGNVNTMIPVIIIDKNNTSINNTVVRIDVESFQFILDQLKGDETDRVGNMHSGNCICPIFLGIYGNITFHYNDYDNTWIVMHNPRIYRTNSLSTLVMSTVKYHYNSMFYDVNLQIRKIYNMDNLIHHNSFIVEYDSLPTFSSPLQNHPTTNTMEEEKNIMYSDNLAELNSRVKSLEERPLILEKILKSERTTIQLINDDAICFNYCDTLNKKTMKIN